MHATTFPEPRYALEYVPCTPWDALKPTVDPDEAHAAAKRAYFTWSNDVAAKHTNPPKQKQKPTPTIRAPLPIVHDFEEQKKQRRRKQRQHQREFDRVKQHMIQTKHDEPPHPRRIVKMLKLLRDGRDD